MKTGSFLFSTKSVKTELSSEHSEMIRVVYFHYYGGECNMIKNSYYRPGLTWKEITTITKEMRDIIGRYGYVTVSDFYELIGGGSRSLPDYYYKIGWRSLKRVRTILGIWGCTVVFPPLRVLF